MFFRSYTNGFVDHNLRGFSTNIRIYEDENILILFMTRFSIFQSSLNSHEEKYLRIEQRAMNIWDLFDCLVEFLDKLPTADDYDYAMEFRLPSWETEGPWEMLKHYNIAAIMTDSPANENLQLLDALLY